MGLSSIAFECLCAHVHRSNEMQIGNQSACNLASRISGARAKQKLAPTPLKLMTHSPSKKPKEKQKWLISKETATHHDVAASAANARSGDDDAEVLVNVSVESRANKNARRRRHPMDACFCTHVLKTSRQRDSTAAFLSATHYLLSARR